MSTAPDLPGPSTAPLGAPYLRPLGRGDGTVAFDEALRTAAPRLRRYAARRLGDLHEAEEVTQEALLRACQHAPGFATEDDLMAWSTVVTGRLVIDRLRLRNRSVSVAEVPEHGRTGRDTADVVVARDEARAALDALEAMPPRQAAVLWSREVEGLSYDDIATRFGLSEPTVRSLLHRARRTLRREYAARGGTLPVAGVLVALAPWHHGLHSLGKLREAARQVLAPAASGAAALTIMGAAAVFVGPGGTGSPHSAPAVAISPSQTASTTGSPAAKPMYKPSFAAPTQAGTPSASTTTSSAPRSGLSRVILGPKCVSNASGTKTGINCAAPDPRVPVLVIHVPLPVNPTNTEVGVSSDKVDCTKLPNTPISRCVKGTHPSPPVRTP
jgi:RNA polymerase sigma-70 factor (ECF subfamily)